MCSLRILWISGAAGKSLRKFRKSSHESLRSVPEYVALVCPWTNNDIICPQFLRWGCLERISSKEENSISDSRCRSLAIRGCLWFSSLRELWIKINELYAFLVIAILVLFSEFSFIARDRHRANRFVLTCSIFLNVENSIKRSIARMANFMCSFCFRFSRAALKMGTSWMLYVSSIIFLKFPGLMSVRTCVLSLPFVRKGKRSHKFLAHKPKYS